MSILYQTAEVSKASQKKKPPVGIAAFKTSIQEPGMCNITGGVPGPMVSMDWFKGKS